MLQWWHNRLEAWQDHLLPCPFKWLTGCDCPACGTQRSVIQLLKGELLESCNQNPLVPGVVLLLAFRVIAPALGLSEWSKYLRIGSWLLALIVALNWILKLISGNCCN
jgi:hypothetical protein